METPEVQEIDPVLIKREIIRKRVRVSKTIGYSLLLISIVSVFACLPLKWPAYLVWIAMITFTLSCVILPLPIIFGYAIKAAEREDKKMGIS